MPSSIPARMVGEGVLADIIEEEIINYGPQSIDLGLSRVAFGNRHDYFRMYSIHLRVGETDRQRSGKLRVTAKGISVAEIFRSLSDMLPKNYEITDSVANNTNGDPMEHRHIVLKQDLSILAEDVALDGDAPGK